MSAYSKDCELLQRAADRGILLSMAQARTLRRAAGTLRKWAEDECGSSNEYASFGLERDEETGVPYRTIYPHRTPSGEENFKIQRYRVPDREKGALARVQAVCKALNLHYYHQGDPRGCALYIDSQPFEQHNYTRGVACDV